MTTITWIFTFIALYGTFLNSLQKKKGFYYWIVSNIAFCVINLYYGIYAQAFLFGVYTVLAVQGIIKWK